MSSLFEVPTRTVDVFCSESDWLEVDDFFFSKLANRWLLSPVSESDGLTVDGFFFSEI
jgi:hypothetical protein